MPWVEDAVQQPAHRRLRDADDRRVPAVPARRIPRRCVSLHRRDRVLCGRGQRARADRGAGVSVRAEGHVRSAVLASAAARCRIRVRALFLFRPPGAGRARLLARKQRMNDATTLSREYNNRVLVPDHPQYLARWAEASARARSTMICYLDRRYGEAPDEAMDIFPARKG